MNFFSISIFGRKHVCRLAYSINNQRNNLQLNLEKRTSSLPTLTSLSRENQHHVQPLSPKRSVTQDSYLSSPNAQAFWSVIAISTSLSRQLFSDAEKRLVFLHRQLSRFKWKFWRKKTGRISHCRLHRF